MRRFAVLAPAVVLAALAAPGTADAAPDAAPAARSAARAGAARPGSGAAQSAAPAAPSAPAAPAEPPLSEAERQFCENEVGVLERREKLFRAQGLPAAEVTRKNASFIAGLAECRARFGAEQRRATEHQQDLEEAGRRVGADATEMERERVYREIRRERLASRSPASLSDEERADLEAGMKDELAATHAALDEAHARDPGFMRVVHSALTCYHGDRKDDLGHQIASEEALLQLGSGDKQKLYGLRSELREAEAVLARSREAAYGYGGRGLERCSSPNIGIVSHCLAARFQGRRAEGACESEEVQQYLRLVK